MWDGCRDYAAMLTGSCCDAHLPSSHTAAAAAATAFPAALLLLLLRLLLLLLLLSNKRTHTHTHTHTHHHPSAQRNAHVGAHRDGEGAELHEPTLEGGTGMPFSFFFNIDRQTQNYRQQTGLGQDLCTHTRAHWQENAHTIRCVCVKNGVLTPKFPLSSM